MLQRKDKYLNVILLALEFPFACFIAIVYIRWLVKYARIQRTPLGYIYGEISIHFNPYTIRCLPLFT